MAPEQWDRAPAIAALEQKFGIGKKLIEAYQHPYLYLNRTAIHERGLDPAAIEKAVADELMKFDGVALALSSTALREGNLPDTPIIQSVLRNYHPQRSGDIFIVLAPYCFINEMDGLTVAANHGSPWRYDTFVPVVFAGGKLKAARVYRAIETVDIAPTLAAVLGAKAPSGSRSSPLPEVLQGFTD